jgi:Lipopolysaccharide kinase (Kdo/WaaP) family.
MRFRLAQPDDYPARLRLPWATPLEVWPGNLFVEVESGLHRNPVRFAEHDGAIYAIKELLERVAEREYTLLRALQQLSLPVVEPIGLVTERPIPPGKADRFGLLVTRFLRHSMPFRHVIAHGTTAVQAYQLLDALAELLVNLHLAGFYWGDCSLSNALFRLDAGRYSAYLVDAETGEIRPSLSHGQRALDLEIAHENVAGEFMDLAAGFGLPDSLDPIDLAAGLIARYENLWTELTREEIFGAQEHYRVDARVARLNALGFDVEEVDLQAIEGGHKLRLRVQVVEPGHHRRRLQMLTRLDAQENQARRLLNDIEHHRARWAEREGTRLAVRDAAQRWLDEVYRPTVALVPAEQRGKLDEAELFHQLLEHRWYLAERQGRDVPAAEVVQSYVREVLAPMRAAGPARVSATDEAGNRNDATPSGSA